MAKRRMVSMKLPERTIAQIKAMRSLYKSQSNVVIEAVERLGREVCFGDDCSQRVRESEHNEYSDPA